MDSKDLQSTLDHNDSTGPLEEKPGDINIPMDDPKLSNSNDYYVWNIKYWEVI